MEYNCNGIEALSALLTPTIAIAGLVIAVLQYRTNNLKRKNDLFDKRYEFYKSVEKLWLSTIDNEIKEFWVEDLIPIASEARILFGNDVADHIMSLENKRHKGSPFFPNDDFSKPFLKYLQLK